MNDAAIQQGENRPDAVRVDTIPELKQRNAKEFYETLVKTNEAKKPARKVPTASQVAEWAKQAKALARGIKY